MEDNRIIVDPHTFNIHSTPRPGLGALDFVSELEVDLEFDEKLDDSWNVVSRATDEAFKKYQKALEKHAEPMKEDDSNECRSTCHLSIYYNTYMTSINNHQSAYFKATTAMHSSHTRLLSNVQNLG